MSRCRAVVINEGYEEKSLMKETVFDVLMYLFDNYFEEDYEINSDQESLKYELVQAGFGDNQVSKAFDWLEGLALQKDLIQSDNLSDKATLRMYSEREMEKLDVKCRGFLKGLIFVIAPQSRLC